MATPKAKIGREQVALVKIAAKDLKLDDGPYRMYLHNIAGVQSSTQLDQVGFEDLLATFEDMGFRFRGHEPDYFRKIVLSRGSFVGSRVAFKIAELAAQQKYDLGGLCRRVSGERVGRVDRLSPKEGHAMIELLKSVIARGATDDPAVNEAAEAAGGLAEPSPGARMPSEASPAAASL